MEKIQVKDEPQSEEEDFAMEEEEIQIKMEPLIMDEDDSDEDTSMQEEVQIKMEPLMKEEAQSDEDSSVHSEEYPSTECALFQGKVKQEPEPSTGIHLRMATCCIPNCGQNETNEIRLFRFPTDEIILAQWLVNTQVKPRLVNPPDLYVCQLHFEPEVVHGTQLEFWSLPTLRLGHEDYLVMDCLKQSEQVMKYIRGQYCSVISCFRSKDDGLRLFEYPDDPETFIKWRRKCRHDPVQIKSYGFRLCASHFSTDSFDPETGDLFAGSQPTRQLYPCLVPGCVRDADTPVDYYKVPNKNDEAEAWSHNLFIPLNTIDRTAQRVCGRHFEDACFTEKKTLRLGSLPTIFLGHDHEVLPNPEKIRLEAEGIRCCVHGCESRRTARDRSFSSFPKDRALARKWIHNIRLDASFKEWPGMLICHEHFEKSCFKNGAKYLRSGAMPTRKLGHPHSDVFESDYAMSFKSTACAIRKKRVRCCHPGCGRHETIVYDLPRTEELHKAWLKHMNIKQIPADPRRAPQLCPIHFVIMYEHSVKNFSEHAPDEILDTNYKVVRNKSSMQALSCSVKGCDTFIPRDSNMLHDMKKVNELQKMWAENGQIDLNPRSRIRVCNKHFEPKCFKNRRLHGWSVPTLNLPGEAIHQNITEEQLEIFSLAAKRCEVKEEEKVQCSVSNSIDGESSPVTFEEQPNDQTLEVVLEVAPNQKSYPEQTTAEILSKPKKFNDNRCAVPGCRMTFKDVNRTFRLHKLPDSDDNVAKWLHNTQIKVTNEYWPSIRICGLHFEQDCFQGSRLRPGAMPTLSLEGKSLEWMHQSEWSKRNNPRPSRFPRAANCLTVDLS
ncbi:hypothetical protein KR084_010331 [Drosophila pseudotakahashii]|nr:hypothetical protein KR084_010331 [Drosophila pseudotakahashii]